MITHLEPEILECEVKWALGSITANKASGADRIPVELFQIQKMILWKCCTQYASKFGKLTSGHRTGKGQFSFQSQRKAIPKNAQTQCTIALISHTRKVMLKILQARLQQYMNCELPDVQAGFRKGRGTRDQIVNILWIIKEAREFQKNFYFCFYRTFTVPKPLTVRITTSCEKLFKSWENQTTWPACWEIWMQVRKQQLELDMKRQTGCK